MSDKEYQELRNCLKALAYKWSERLGLGWYKLHFEWIRDYAYDKAKDRRDIGGEARSQWQYREATLTFYLEKLASSTKEEQEEVVIHELCHVLVSPIEDFSDSNSSQMTEYTTTMVAKAAKWAYDDGIKQGKRGCPAQSKPKPPKTGRAKPNSSNSSTKN